MSAPNILYCEMSLSILQLCADGYVIAKPKKNCSNMRKLDIFGKHIMVEPYIGDTRFDRCILLAENSPDALDWPSLPRELRRPDFLPVRDNVACLAGDTLGCIIGSARVYSCATAAPAATAAATSSRRSMQQLACSSSCCCCWCKLFLQNLAG